MLLIGRSYWLCPSFPRENVILLIIDPLGLLSRTSSKTICISCASTLTQCLKKENSNNNKINKRNKNVMSIFWIIPLTIVCWIQNTRIECRDWGVLAINIISMHLRYVRWWNMVNEHNDFSTFLFKMKGYIFLVIDSFLAFRIAKWCHSRSSVGFNLLQEIFLIS